MKQFITYLLFFFFSLGISAQEVTVKSFKEEISDLSARTNRKYDVNDEACALIKVQYPKAGATFEGNVVGDVEYKNGEYWVYVSKGTKRFKIHLPDVPTIVVEFADYGVQQVESNTTYSLYFNIIKPKSASTLKSKFYVEAGMLIGGTMAPELSIGTYLGGFNVELNMMLPMGKSDEVYWYKGNQQVVATYKPSFAVGGRIGYGIMVGKSFRITPQVGVNFMKTAETLGDNASANIASGAYCSSLVVAVKLQYLVSKNFGISISPEYDAHIMKSEGFKAISESSKKVKGWGNGIGVKAALNIEF